MSERFIFDTMFYMKRAVTKTKLNSKSGLPEVTAKSKKAVKKDVEANSRKTQKLKTVSKSSKPKTEEKKSSRKKEITEKSKTAKSSLGKNSVLKNKTVKQASSKVNTKTAVSTKKNNLQIKAEIVKTKLTAKPEVSKNPVTAKKAALPKSNKKTASDVKSPTLKSKKLTQKVSSKVSVKTKPEAVKKRISTVKKSVKSVQKKAETVKTVVSKSKAKSQPAVKAKSLQPANVSKSKTANKPVSRNQKANLNRIKPGGKAVVVKKLSPAAKPEISAKTISTVKKAQIKHKPEKKPVAITKKPQNKTVKTAGKVLVGKKNQPGKPVKPLISNKKIRIAKNKIVEKISAKKVSRLKNITNSAPAEIKKPRKKPVRPISSAVFRGKKSLYDFKVFSIDEKFEPVQAVYIISRRITDRRKRGHHKLICIGQTDSVTDGIKMHKKGKCIKQNEANVICLLKEEDEKNRLRIEADLREAHSVTCNQQ